MCSSDLFGFLKSDTHIDTADGRAVSYATAHVQPHFERWEQTDVIFRTAKPLYDANPTLFVQECLDYAITESARTDLHGKMSDCNYDKTNEESKKCTQLCIAFGIIPPKHRKHDDHRQLSNSYFKHIRANN